MNTQTKCFRYCVIYNYLIFIITLVISHASHAVVLEWTATVNEQGRVYQSIQKYDAEGNEDGFIAAGYIRTDDGQMIATLTELDSAGKPKSSGPRLFEGLGNSRFYTIVPSISSSTNLIDGYTAFGITWNTGSNSQNLYRVKINLDGSIAWEIDSSLGGTINRYMGWPMGATERKNGGYAVVVSLDGPYPSRNFVYSVVLNTDGEETNNSYLLSGAGDYGASSIQETIDEGFILSGYTTIYGCAEWRAWNLKLDSSYQKEWHSIINEDQACYTGFSNFHRASEIYQLNDSGEKKSIGYVFAGHQGHKGWVYFTDIDGWINWEKVGGAAVYGVLPSEDTGGILAYTAKSLDYGVMRKLDAQGNEVWSHSYLPSSIPNMGNIVKTADNGFIIADRNYVAKLAAEGVDTGVGTGVIATLKDSQSGKDPVTVEFEQVYTAGTTVLEIRDAPSGSAPDGFKIQGEIFFTIESTAKYEENTNSIKVCINVADMEIEKKRNDDGSGKPGGLILSHSEKDQNDWNVVEGQQSTFYDKEGKTYFEEVCGFVDGFSDFVLLEPLNEAPQANAGSDVTLQCTSAEGYASVSLDGTASFDPDGDLLTYQWIIDDSYEFSEAVLDVDIFVGTHQAILTVNDGQLSNSDDLYIKVNKDLQGLNAYVASHVEVGSVSESDALVLFRHLDDAFSNYSANKFDKAKKDMDQFKHEIDKILDSGRISNESADLLTGAANCVNNFELIENR